MKVYLEVGRRRTFACAVDWMGWCRSGKTEEDALRALVDYGPRYMQALGDLATDLKLPRAIDELDVVGRYEGDATTDFGAPGAIPDSDRRDTSADEVDRLVEMLEAAWRTFDAAADAARGNILAPAGPRGGGRELEKIREHVSGADQSYTGAIGGKAPREDEVWPPVRRAFVEAVRARARGEIPDRGPRGGVRWPARYAIRRSAWHALDHAWEIDDRAKS